VHIISKDIIYFELLIIKGRFNFCSRFFRILLSGWHHA